MKNFFIIFFLLLSYSAFSQAENKIQTEKQVSDIVYKFFEEFKKGDTAKIRELFHPSASLTSVSKKGSASKVTVTTLGEFLNAIGKPHQEVWDERIFDLKTHSDGIISTIWVKYGFYVENKFSHCGVDVFNLANTERGWKIIQISDSRDQENCREHIEATKK